MEGVDVLTGPPAESKGAVAGRFSRGAGRLPAVRQQVGDRRQHSGAGQTGQAQRSVWSLSGRAGKRELSRSSRSLLQYWHRMEKVRRSVSGKGISAGLAAGGMGGTWAVTFHTDRFLSPCQNRLGRHREIFTDDLLFLYFSYSENCAWIVGRFPWSAFFRSIPVVLPGMAAYCFGRVWLSSDPASAVKSAGRPAGCLSGIPAILWPC